MKKSNISVTKELDSLDCKIKRICLNTNSGTITSKKFENNSLKEIISEFVFLLRKSGYSYNDIKFALGTRSQIKELNVEIGKLKSYIDELTYELNKFTNEEKS